MKRSAIVALLLLAVFLLSSCYDSSGFTRKRSHPPMDPATESTYYPLR